MRKRVAIIVIIALILLTVFVVNTNPQLHKTFQIEQLIIKRGVK